MPLAATTELVSIEVTGSDRVSHLDAATTQRFLGVPTGAVRGWLVLDGKGAPLATGWALVDDERIVLLAPPPAADHVLDVLAMRTFLADVTFTRLDTPTVSLGGIDLDLALAAAGIDPPVDTWIRHDDVIVARHAFGVEVVGSDDPDHVVSTEVVDADTLWLQRGEPRWGHEVVPGRLPEEYGLLATHVHLAKGCYPGQEPIAHMWMLGRPRRQLVRLGPVADDSGAAVAGEPETAEVEVTGRAGDTALGFARPGVAVGALADEDLVVTAAVGADRAVAGWTPAQKRRRDRAEGEALPGRRP